MHLNSATLDLHDHQSRKRLTRRTFEEQLKSASIQTLLGLELPEAPVTEDLEPWLPVVLELAKRSLPLKDISTLIGVGYSAFTKNEALTATARSGHALYRLTVEQGLYALATEDVAAGEDPIERSSIRTTKLKALQVMKNALDKKDEWVPEAEKERLRRLTDDELKAAIKDAAAKL